MKQKLNIKRFIKNNSPTMLTVVGSIGVIVTAIMSARDTVKAMKRIEKEKPILTKTKIKIAAPCYIPTIISGVSTILCVCGANKLNKGIQKSLTSAYVLLDQSYREYRKSVKELHGEDGDLEVVKHIANKKADELNIAEREGSDIFFDFFSLQFFNSDLLTIQKAEKEANEMLEKYGYVSLKTVYSLIGENTIETDDLLGWSLAAGKDYGYDHIEIEVVQNVKEDGSKYYVLDFINAPTEDYGVYQGIRNI